MSEVPGSSTALWQPLSFRHGQAVGRRSRHLELQTTVDRFRKVIQSCVSGFLNTGEGGRLYLGLDDLGKVVGCHMTREQQNDLKEEASRLISQFQPKIPDHACSLWFIPVDGKHDTYVVVTEVKPVGRAEQPYHHVADVPYLRYEASTRALSDRQVEEIWSRRPLEEACFRKERQHEQVIRQRISDLVDCISDLSSRLAVYERRMAGRPARS